MRTDDVAPAGRRKDPPGDRFGRRVRSLALLILAGSIVVGGLQFDRALERVDAAEARQVRALPTRLRAAPLRLSTGGPEPLGGLFAVLEAMGYQERPEALAPGQFTRRASGWTRVAPHRGTAGEGRVGSVDLRIDGRRIVSIRDARGSTLDRAILPAAEFARLQGRGAATGRLPGQASAADSDSGSDSESESSAGSSRGDGAAGRVVALADLPQPLLDAVIASEDQRFYEHFGLDVAGIGRALLANAAQARIAQGGSTISQQLAKGLFLGRERTLRRKLDEAFLALALERRLGKGEILERYLNTVYVGRRGTSAIIGLPDAAYAYFSRGLDELNLAELATLVGMIPAPNRFAPDRHPERAASRRAQVLAAMRDAGKLSTAEYEEALKAKVVLRPAPFDQRTAPFFVDYVAQELERVVARDVLLEGGYEVETTVDLRIQAIAETALREGVGALEIATDVPLEGASVVASAETGALLALVGGRDFGRSQFNRAAHARRPIGSLAKPLLVLAAIEAKRERITPDFLLLDEPVAIRTRQGTYKPKNLDGQFRGPVTLREAMARSLNVPFVRLADEVGLDAVRRHFRILGLSVPEQVGLSVALGAVDATPVEVAGAYSALASYGMRRAPHAIRRVRSRSGEVLYERPETHQRLASPQGAYLVSELLRGVIDHGTGRGVRSLGYQGELAGKTGTSDDTKDAWFVGFDRELVVVVWVGADQPRAMKRTASRTALPIAARMLQEIRRGVPPPPSVLPSGLERVALCAASSQRATPKCPELVHQIIWASESEGESCEIHREAGWFESLLRGPQSFSFR